MMISFFRYKRFWTALLLLSFSFLLSLLLAEATVRVLAPQQPVAQWFKESDTYCYTLKKNFHQRFPFVGSDFVMDVRTNSLGHRDPEPKFSYPDGTPTVMFLGDSFTFGYGVNIEDRFDMQLARLCEEAGRPVRTVNTGVPGWGTTQELMYARSVLGVFDPDVIVLTFCSNDPHDDALFARGEMIFKERGLFSFPGKIFLRNHSQLYRFALLQTKLLRHRWYLRKKQEANPDATVDGQSASLVAQEEWEGTLAQIRQFYTEYRAHNPKGLLLIQSTDPTQEVQRTQLQSLDNGDCLRYVDLDMEASRLTPEQRMLPYDGHWSVAMHTISAQQLFKQLAR